MNWGTKYVNSRPEPREAMWGLRALQAAKNAS